ncbi:hypothetical protein IF1G_04526 [Cordyceps javanica]|uniref:Uncharacterized protein n=1 Tax=Cordyceps javanica TaxID=43265 RepID=A0A545V6D9_9HYPO|nr:hypothetical protein IF1G_04526 [Cordyceps javanica]
MTEVTGARHMWLLNHCKQSLVRHDMRKLPATRMAIDCNVQCTSHANYQLFATLKLSRPGYKPQCRTGYLFEHCRQRVDFQRHQIHHHELIKPLHAVGRVHG